MGANPPSFQKTNMFQNKYTKHILKMNNWKRHKLKIDNLFQKRGLKDNWACFLWTFWNQGLKNKQIDWKNVGKKLHKHSVMGDESNSNKKIKLVWQMTFQTKTLLIVVDAKKLQHMSLQLNFLKLALYWASLNMTSELTFVKSSFMPFLTSTEMFKTHLLNPFAYLLTQFSLSLWGAWSFWKLWACTQLLFQYPNFFNSHTKL